jgi:hypothetical protein
MHPDLAFAPIHHRQCHLPPSFRPAGERVSERSKAGVSQPATHPDPASTPVHYRQCNSSTLFPACRREGRPAKRSRPKGLPCRVSQHAMHPDPAFAPIHYCQCHFRPSFRPAGGGSTSEAKSARRAPLEGESTRHASRPCIYASLLPPMQFPPSLRLAKREWPGEAAARLPPT